MKIPRILIAATRAKSGKTLISCAVMSVLVKRGLKIQPFKVGPDFIDPSYHSVITGSASRNLDSYMFNRDTLLWTFTHHSADCNMSIIEGVFGLYDSPDGLSEHGSTAEVAKILNCPVILILDAQRSNRSLLATVKGFRDFDPQTQIKGIILNNIGTRRQEEKIHTAIRTFTPNLKILGTIPRSTIIEEKFKYRHLGLVPTAERAQDVEAVQNIITNVAGHIDITSINEIAQAAEDIPPPATGMQPPPKSDANVGVIRDKAFSFYYPENLEYLEAGAKQVHYVNSFTDSELPNLDLLYIGGGFPEVYAAQLQRNENLTRSIRKNWSSGMHIYAECGGLMYLTKAILDFEGKHHKLVGLLDGVVRMENAPIGHGYVRLKTTQPNPIATYGTEILGHEFHHSRIDFGSKPTFAFQVLRGHGIDGEHDGILKERLLATYTHLHVLHNPNLFHNLIASLPKTS